MFQMDTSIWNEADDEFNSTSDWSSLFKLSEVDSNIVGYIGGYIATKLNRKLGCLNCEESFEECRTKEKQSTSLSTSGRFLQNKEFDWAKKGLTIPSPELFHMLYSLEKTIQMNLEGLCSSNHFSRNLKECFSACTDMYSFELRNFCPTHRLHGLNLVVNLYIRIRIHHFVKIRNRELKELAIAKKVNRKFNKIVHA